MSTTNQNPVVHGGNIKESKRYREWRLRHLHPAKSPEAILASWSITQFDQADFERACWVWQRRPKRRFSVRFWRWLTCILAPAVATPFLHLPPPFSDVLVDFSLVSGLILVFIYGRHSDQWAQWRSDYSRAIDRLLFRQS